MVDGIAGLSDLDLLMKSRFGEFWLPDYAILYPMHKTDL